MKNVFNFFITPFKKKYISFFIQGFIFFILWFLVLGLGGGVLIGMGGAGENIGNLFFIFIFGGYLLISALIAYFNKTTENDFWQIFYSIILSAIIYFLFSIISIVINNG